jgi:hypothetical protein
MAIFSNISGTWKKVSKVFNNVSGTWKEAKALYANVSGTWKQLHSSAAQFTYTSSQPTNGRSIVLTDIFDAATIAANTNFVITVNAGVTLGTSTGVPVFDFSGVTGKNITIINNGTIKAGTGAGTTYWAVQDAYYVNKLCAGLSPVGLYASEIATSTMDGVYNKHSCATSPGTTNGRTYWSTTQPPIPKNCMDVSGQHPTEYWGTYSTVAGTVVQATVNGSNTVTVTGNAVQTGNSGPVTYKAVYYTSCNCDCGGTSG